MRTGNRIDIQQFLDLFQSCHDAVQVLGVGDAHGHAPLRQRAFLVDLRFKRRVDAQHLAGHAIILFARVGQHQPAGGARKQPRAELLLEGHHTMAQRRLGDKKLLRGAGHALFVRDGLDVKQFSGGHGVSSCGGFRGKGFGRARAARGARKARKKRRTGFDR